MFIVLDGTIDERGEVVLPCRETIKTTVPAIGCRRYCMLQGIVSKRRRSVTIAMSMVLAPNI
jgi:hypothetical protein